MNAFECYNNLTRCFELYEVVPCPSSANHCFKYDGVCFINKVDETRCVCSDCFSGDHCETEVSRNLWELGMAFDGRIENLTLIDNFLRLILWILGLLSGLLCLQTYLCRKIRQTNLGIYLIMLSIISTFLNLSRLVWLLTDLLLPSEGSPTSLSRGTIVCLYLKYVDAPLFPMFSWFIAAVAIERVLVECSVKYSLYDSRRRSVVFSSIIVIVCCLSTLPGVFTVNDNLSPKAQPMYCLNLTPAGYRTYITVESIHLCAFYLIYIVMNLLILIKLVRRRQRLVDDSSLFYQIRLILIKHKDFLIPYLIQAICLLPSVVMNLIMTCSTAGTMSIFYMDVVITVLGLLPFALVFYLYVCLSPVYLSIFWDSSPVDQTHFHPFQLKSNLNWKPNAKTIAGGNGKGDKSNQLNRPVAIYVDDQQQSIYIADHLNHRIVKWKSGENSGQIIGGGNDQGNRIDQLNQPADVIIDQKNKSLIICDWGNSRVVRWSLESQQDKQIIIENIKCWGLMMNENGDLFVSDSEKNEVKRWRKGEKEGTIVAGGNGKGDQLNQLNEPTFIFIDRQETVYASDCWNHRVMKWMKGAKEGIVFAGGQGEGNSLKQLSYPEGLCVNEVGDVYVADSLNDRIMCWSSGSKEGRVVVGGNGEGQGSNQFYRLRGFSFDVESNLYVVDKWNNRVQRFSVHKNSNEKKKKILKLEKSY